MTAPLTSIIILNWNGKNLVKECLDSLKNQTYKNLEIIVVDNGSTDGSVRYIKDNFMHFVRLIENKTNLGFSGGNNTGLEISRGKYVLLLNNDAVAEPSWAEELVNVAQADDRIGMCASKILLYDNSKVIDSVGLLIYKDGLSKQRGRLEYDNGQYDIGEEVFCPSGCAALYRKEMFDEIGGFDEDFFAYSDDTDISIRGRLLGWRCVYVPKAIIHHKYSGSTSAYSLFKAFYAERNRLWIAIKYFPLALLLGNPYYTLVRSILQIYGALLHKGAAGKFKAKFSSSKLLFTLLRAYLSAMNGIPKMLKKREEIYKLRKISNKEIYSWFRRFKLNVAELALKE